MTNSTSTETEISSAIRHAAQPFICDPIGADRARILALPPGWTTASPIIPAVNPAGHAAYEGVIVNVSTPGGFAAELQRTAGSHPVALYDEFSELVGVVNPGVFGQPHVTTTVLLNLQRSRELQMLVDMVGLSLDDWERRLDNIAPIIADGGASYADLLADVRNWATESRREYSRIKKDETAETHEKQEAVTRLRSKAIAAFTVAVPLFLHDEPVDLVVKIDRDVEAAKISARIPGLDLLLDQRRSQLFQEAANYGGWDIIR